MLPSGRFHRNLPLCVASSFCALIFLLWITPLSSLFTTIYQFLFSMQVDGWRTWIPLTYQTHCRLLFYSFLLYETQLAVFVESWVTWHDMARMAKADDGGALWPFDPFSQAWVRLRRKSHSALSQAGKRKKEKEKKRKQAIVKAEDQLSYCTAVHTESVHCLPNFLSHLPGHGGGGSGSINIPHSSLRLKQVLHCYHQPSIHSFKYCLFRCYLPRYLLPPSPIPSTAHNRVDSLWTETRYQSNFYLVEKHLKDFQQHAFHVHVLVTVPPLPGASSQGSSPTGP